MKLRILVISGGAVLLLLFFINSLACDYSVVSKQTQHDSIVKINFKKVKTFKPPVSPGQNSFRPRYLHVQNDSIITFLTYNSKLIRYWNINKNKYVDSINVDVFDGYEFIWGYKIISRDSIILSYNTTYFGNFHDNAVILIDRDKNITGKFNFQGAPVPMFEKESRDHKKRERGLFENDWSFQIHMSRFPLIYDKKKNAVLTTISKFHFYPASYNQVIAGWVYLDSTKKI